MTKYPHLFSPLTIGSVTVRNRLMQTAHAKLFTDHGTDSKRDFDYLVARARGGIGLMITGNRIVHPSSPCGSLRFSLGYLTEAIAVDRRMTDAVHSHGAAIIAQLNHFGVNAASDAADDLRVLMGPSAVKSPMFGETPKAMEVEDIREVTEWWARCAEYSRESGFDGVEIHLAHGYLLNEFLSPLYNQRSDAYGGSLENRLRFAREVIAATRARTGKDFVVGVRLTLTDAYPGGLEVDDAIAVARLLEADGQIDFIDVSGGGYHSGLRALIAPADVEDGWLLERIARLKGSVGTLPVFAVGGITDGHLAETVIASGQADMVAMTRAQIADPQLPNKLRAARESEIYRCIRGNQMCVGRTGKALPIGCTVNPETGREGRFGSQELPPADMPERWLVVGGGPAGMKAAETLAGRGHHVILVESERRLGGQVNLIVKTPGRERFGVMVEDLERQLHRHGVQIRLGVTATAQMVAELAPQHILVATGATPDRSGFCSVAPSVRELPGVRSAHVSTGWDVLLDPDSTGERTVILDDEGSRQVAGVAEVLLDRGRQVEIVSRWTSLFPFTVNTLDQPILYERLLGTGLRFRLNSWCRGIESNSVVVYDLYTGRETTIEHVDSVILATGRKAADSLYFALKGIAADVHRIGDCVAPRSLDHAIYEGYLAGREIWRTEDRYIYDGALERWPVETALTPG